ncbi:hypothetical protein ACFX13_037726 [Malus domestica]
MRHQSTVDFSAIEAESFKALKLEPSSDDELRRVRGPSLPKTCCSASSEYYAAWGEDLVLALRPGEIIPSERLRDTETGIGPGGRYLWLRAQRLRCRHWAGSIIIQCTH